MLASTSKEVEGEVLRRLGEGDSIYVAREQAHSIKCLEGNSFGDKKVAAQCIHAVSYTVFGGRELAGSLVDSAPITPASEALMF